MIEAYLIHLLILIGIYLILGLSLQITVGYGGILNLGHIAFFCIGAYASALLTMNGFPFFWAIILAGMIAMVSGFLLSLPSRKLKGDYLTLVTMGFGFVVYALALNWMSLTNGPIGIPGIPKPEIFGIIFGSNDMFLVLTIIFAAITYFCIHRITHSEFGKVLQATRDDELSAKALGKDTFRVKAYALASSAFFAGIAGSLYAHYITYIDPTSFTIFQLIPIITIVIVAGLASLKGTAIATVIIVLIPESLRFVGFPSSIVGPARQMLFALILILILLYKPKGFFGNVELE